MRYSLKDYQSDAVGEVLGKLARAKEAHDKYGDLVQFSLSAATGAGKTVMAAAIIEALFFGSDEFNFPRDPGAVVLWFSDDPSLNEQSRARIQAASPELGGRLRVIEPPFAEPTLHPGNVYFLNTQKLSKNSRLVRGRQNQDSDDDALFQVPPDMMQTNIYDVLANTINNPDLTLYMILDEAHRGMQQSKDHATIVQRLINGHNGIPPIPIVLGISATVERFNQTMEKAQNRTALPSVTVDSTQVQASGLLKDDIVLTIPAEKGTFDTVLLTRAVEKLRKSTQAWAEYSHAQEEPVSVVPLLVVQMGDKPTDAELSRTLTTIFDAWPELPSDCVANVFGEHTDLNIAGYHVPYIEPQRVQDDTWCRILLAKTAISTGWDCPRAEVLVSFRPASDPTHITQLLGRMIRTPLARRIPGNELLNSVDCLLPFFNRDTAMNIAEMLMRGSTEDGPGPGESRRVLFNPVELSRNPKIPESVWQTFEKLPTCTIPKGHVKPIKRFTALAALLAKDQIRETPVSDAAELLCKALDGKAVQYADEVAEAREDVEAMSGEELRRKIGGGKWKTESFSAVADTRALDDSYRTAARALSPSLAGDYVDHLAPQGSDEDALTEARVQVAALGIVPEIVNDVEKYADELSRKWLDETRVARKNLSDTKQAEYERIERMSLTPERVFLRAPKVAQTESKVRLPDGTEQDLPTDGDHLLVDADGDYPFDLNTWETKVLNMEKARDGFVGWYRNPSRAGVEALSIPYKSTDKWKALWPDFIFFSEVNGEIVIDLVDPHGIHLADAMPKLVGLAKYVEEFGNEFRRIESVAEINGELRVLDMKNQRTRKAIEEFSSAEELYASDFAADYL